MKFVLCLSLLVATGSAWAAKPAPKYKTKFENPVVDARIVFVGCAVEGALYGIARGEPESVICWGKGDNGKDYFVFKGADRKTQDYFEQVAEKDLGGWSEDGSMGVRESSVSLINVTSALTPAAKTHRSTLKYRTEWMYSEGNTILRGKLPGTTTQIQFPVYDLGSLDQELRSFVNELKN